MSCSTWTLVTFRIYDRRSCARGNECHKCRHEPDLNSEPGGQQHLVLITLLSEPPPRPQRHWSTIDLLLKDFWRFKVMRRSRRRNTLQICPRLEIWTLVVEICGQPRYRLNHGDARAAEERNLDCDSVSGFVFPFHLYIGQRVLSSSVLSIVKQHSFAFHLNRSHTMELSIACIWFKIFSNCF